MHSIMDPPVGTFAGSIVEPTDVPTEDILPPTEDILPALEHSPVRFMVGIVISAKLSHLACTPMPWNGCSLHATSATKAPGGGCAAEMQPGAATWPVNSSR